MLQVLQHSRQLFGQLATALPATAALHLDQVRHAKTAAKKKKAPATVGKGGKSAGAGKSKKQGMRTGGFDEKDPFMQKILSYMVPQEPPPVQPSPEELAVATARAKEYSRLKIKEHIAWRDDLNRKLQLKHAALRALPPELRMAARKEDLAPFPLTRHFLYFSAPEAYRD
eukprot:jgi/Chrzof1/6247/Cz17g17100.t1